MNNLSMFGLTIPTFACGNNEFKMYLVFILFYLVFAFLLVNVALIISDLKELYCSKDNSAQKFKIFIPALIILQISLATSFFGTKLGEDLTKIAVECRTPEEQLKTDQVLRSIVQQSINHGVNCIQDPSNAYCLAIALRSEQISAGTTSSSDYQQVINSKNTREKALEILKTAESNELY
ncbi:MAG: hypothetical protein E6Q32_03155 [Neisseriales bacterium]|nr:MAG: hypothetical protein E6Q32_03155 [Neisseriales bacterium]